MSPAGVVAVIQLGLSLARLFSPEGPSVVDLLSIQTKMLSKVASQLGVIQAGITEILTRLNDIDNLLGEIPAETVQLEFRTLIGGLANRYDEISRIYARDIQSGKGIPFATKASASALREDVIKPLQRSRDVLFTFDSQINILALSYALYIENHAMIMANYRTNEKIEALESYKQYFLKFRFNNPASLLPRIDTLRERRSATLEKLVRPQQIFCKIEPDKLRFLDACAGDDGLHRGNDVSLQIGGIAMGYEHLTSMEKAVSKKGYLSWKDYVGALPPTISEPSGDLLKTVSDDAFLAAAIQMYEQEILYYFDLPINLYKQEYLGNYKITHCASTNRIVSANQTVQYTGTPDSIFDWYKVQRELGNNLPMCSEIHTLFNQTVDELFLALENDTAELAELLSLEKVVDDSIRMIDQYKSGLMGLNPSST